MRILNKSISVLIPDAESVICLNVVNCLSQIKGIKIFIMSNEKRCSIKYSRHIDNFKFYPKVDNELDWIDNINSELKEHSIDLLMPIFDIGIQTVIKYKEHVLKEVKQGLVSSFSDFILAKDKGCLSNFLNSNNLPHPRGIVINSVSQLDKINLNFPVLVKPVEGIGGGTGIILYSNKNDLEVFFENKINSCDYVVQEYIEGYDMGCCVLCKEGAILAHTIYKSTIEKNKQFSPLIGFKFIEDEKIYSVIEKTMKLLNWSGVANIDLLYDIKDREVKIIEINTRFWGSIEASLVAGVNFPYLYILKSLDMNFQKPNYRYVEYLKLHGVLKTLRKQKRFVFNINLILQNTQLKFIMKDPLPAIYHLFSSCKKYIFNYLNFKQKKPVH